MQAIIASIGTTGDILPAIAVARALIARGHAVRLLANPAFARLVTNADVAFVPVGDAQRLRAMLASNAYWDRSTGFGVFARSEMLSNIRPMGAAIQSLAAGTPSFVVAFTFAVGAILVGLELQLPTIRVVLTPSALSPDGAFARHIRMAAQLAGHAGRAMGLAGTDMTPPTIGLFPGWFAGHARLPVGTIVTGFPLAEEEGDIPPALHQLLQSGEPPVVAFAGSDRPRASAFMAMASAAIARSGRRAVLVTADPTVTYRDGDQHLCTHEVPFGWLFPRVAAVVHHGGIGTIARCLASGVPQLAVASGFDGPENAAAMAELGVGFSVSGRDFDQAALTAHLQEVLSNVAVHSACDAWRQRIEDDNPFPATAGAIDRIVASHG